MCFHGEEDYQYYLHYLEEFSTKFGCTVHAYALMTTHVHLLFTPQRADSASLLMKHLGQRYVQYINRVYRRSGRLWEGQLRSCLTPTENYVLACYRYIELDPVRAGIVLRPQDYRRSSYHANALGRASRLIVPHDEYLRLRSDDAERQEAYRAMFKARMDEEVVGQIRSATNSNYALGSEGFQREIAKMLGRRAIKGQSDRPCKEKMIDKKQGNLL